MANHNPQVVFDTERAASYDKRTDRLAATRDALYLLMQIVLSELPANSRVLCVGVGTGAELIALAQAFPDWQFTAVEPATAMLDVCRQRVAAEGLTARCTFHAGYLDTLPASDEFDAATCLLVSHFFMELEARRDFFRQIAARLRSGGLLISSDLSADRTTPAYASMRAVWKRMLEYAQFPPEDVAAFLESHGKTAAVLPPREVEVLLTASGFVTPVLFYQSLFIHAWYSRRA